MHKIQSVRAIFFENIGAVLVAHFIICIAALYCLAAQEYRAVRMALYALIAIWPAMIAHTYLAARRAHKGEPPNDVMDGSLPALGIFLVVYVLSLVLV